MAEQITITIGRLVATDREEALAKIRQGLELAQQARRHGGYLKVGGGVYEASLEIECRPRWARIAAPVVATLGLGLAGALIIIAVAFAALREWLIWFGR